MLHFRTDINDIIMTLAETELYMHCLVFMPLPKVVNINEPLSDIGRHKHYLQLTLCYHIILKTIIQLGQKNNTKKFSKISIVRKKCERISKLLPCSMFYKVSAPVMLYCVMAAHFQLSMST